MSPEGDSHVARATELACQCLQPEASKDTLAVGQVGRYALRRGGSKRAPSEGVRKNASDLPWAPGEWGRDSGGRGPLGSESISISLAFGQERDKEGEASVGKEQAVTHVSQEGAVRYSVGGTGTLVLSVFRQSDEAALLVS